MFDITASLFGLASCLPLFVVIGFLVKIDSRGPVFYRQERMGRNFKPFDIYKFRTMEDSCGKTGPLVTVAGDRRITRVGRVLRKYKIDEFPQLINVLKGDMSFVGPRPEVRKYVEIYKDDYEKLLKISPGITDPSSLAYIKEEEVLASSERWEEEYIKRVLPDKIKSSMEYVNSRTFIGDIGCVVRTVLRTFRFTTTKV